MDTQDFCHAFLVEPRRAALCAPACAPRRIDLVAELPLNGPGKLDRKVVQRLMRERCGVLG